MINLEDTSADISEQHRTTRTHKRGQHPDRLAIGIAERCPRCRNGLALVVSQRGGVSTHACQGLRCAYALSCPRHDTSCILSKIVRHEALPKCARGHSGTWACLAGQKGRVYTLLCFAPSVASGYGYCGSSYRHWIGPRPTLPQTVGVDRVENDATKFAVLLAFSKYTVLTAVQCSQVSGLELRPVRACIRRLVAKRLPHLELAGQIYDGGSDKTVLTYRIDKYGLAWLKYQVDSGRFSDG